MDTIRIAEQFTPFPGGRYPKDGAGNGTTFRENFLLPVLENKGRAKIVLDGARGYPSSFLEEAFGGLVRVGYRSDEIESAFEIEATDPRFKRFVDLIKEHVSRAERLKAQQR